MTPTPGQEIARPWRASYRFDDAGESRICIVEAATGDWVECGTRGNERAETFARFTVQALNAHAPMLHALRVAGTVLDHVLNGGTLTAADDIDAALMTVREAIRAGELK